MFNVYGGNKYRVRVYVRNQNTLRFEAFSQWNGGLNTGYRRITGGVVSLNVWNKAVFTTEYINPKQFMKIYLNGSDVQSYNFTGFHEPCTSNDQKLFGASKVKDAWASNNFYKGRIGYFALHNTVLTIADITPTLCTGCSGCAI
jgi:hypothetical protein